MVSLLFHFEMTDGPRRAREVLSDVKWDEFLQISYGASGLENGTAIVMTYVSQGCTIGLFDQDDLDALFIAARTKGHSTATVIKVRVVPSKDEKRAVPAAMDADEAVIGNDDEIS